MHRGVSRVSPRKRMAWPRLARAFQRPPRLTAAPLSREPPRPKNPAKTCREAKHSAVMLAVTRARALDRAVASELASMCSRPLTGAEEDALLVPLERARATSQQWVEALTEVMAAKTPQRHPLAMSKGR